MTGPIFRMICLGWLLLFAEVVADSISALDENDPFFVDHRFPKLTTPQWIGDAATEAVVVLAIDDMREPKAYETYLRPILARLKARDGKGHVSIMSNAIDPSLARYQSWLEEGVSLEVHTLTHPCPLLSKRNFGAAEDTFFGGIDLLNHVPGNRPVAYRMPCCDSINSPSPRFYAELFNRTNPAGQFLQIDSSIMCVYTAADPELPREWIENEAGEPRFERYLPFDSFVTTIENYPYPYIIGQKCWEFPCMVPSDWEAQNVQGVNHEDTVRDWKRALDLTVLKQGVFNLVFHPHGWIRSDQVIELIEYAETRYGDRVKFLNFEECLTRLNENLLQGQGIRDEAGEDNGVRLLDLNQDGYLDVVIANRQLRVARTWSPDKSEWTDVSFPIELIERDGRNSGVKFARLKEGELSALVRTEKVEGAWSFREGAWAADEALIREFQMGARAIFSQKKGVDTGLRFRDLDRDGLHELIVGGELGGSVLRWSEGEQTWRSEGYALPAGVKLVDELGRDNGVRFVDINRDGFDDLILSNEERVGLHLYIPEVVLGFARGWSRTVVDRKRSERPSEIPSFVRSGPFRQNGVWFHSGHLWVQNEDTAHLPDLVDRRSFDGLLAGDLPEPVSPQEGISLMQHAPDLTVELVAAEPLIADPIYFDWDTDGSLWVVEMGDYPAGIDGKGKGGGKVRRLTDQDQDGVYENSIVFLEGLNFPTGLIPWGNGVLVSAAPDIFYAEDRDGDGRADYREVWYTGFREGNQQHRVNGFSRGLDGWFYGANGDSGGIIHGASDGGEVNISGRDFRFHPVTKEFEAIEGRTQFGRHRDDWGNWFGNNNPNWLWHFWFPESYLVNNPDFPLPTNKRFLGRDDPFVYSVGASLQRFNDVGHRNHVTSGNSPTPYRDDLFAGDYRNSVFVSEPVHNVIHREVLSREGVSFTSRRSDGEKDREFLASVDPWFRPTGMKTGPDGALYFADMYRLVIEHPEWIPDDVAAVIDLRSGSERGRIYRVYPAKRPPRVIPRLGEKSDREWVQYLRSSNGWVRDRAQSLIVRSKNPGLAALVRSQLQSENLRSKSLLQSLWTLNEMGALTEADLLVGLESSSVEVRRNAIQLAEPFLIETLRVPDPSPRTASLKSLSSRLVLMGEDPNESVRMQLALSIGLVPGEGYSETLFRLALTAESSELMNAIEVSLPKKLRSVILCSARDPKDFLRQKGWYSTLLRYAVKQRDEEGVESLLATVLSDASIRQTNSGLDFFRLYLAELRRSGLRGNAHFDVTSPHYKSEGLRDAMRLLMNDAELVAFSRDEDVERRALSIAFVVEAGMRLDLLARALEARESTLLQSRVLQLLRHHGSSELISILKKSWPVLRASVRSLVARQWFNRPSRLAARADEFFAGDWAGILEMPELRDSLTRLGDSRLMVLGESPDQDRAKALSFEQMLQSVFANRGNPLRGQELFKLHCSSCHRLAGQGYEVGPDLRAVSDRSTRAWLLAIMEPNRAVESKFLAYTVETESGDAMTGVISEETGNSLTLRIPNSEPVILVRNQISELRESNLSLMPEGLAEQIGAGGLADLIAFLQQPHQLSEAE